MNNPAQIQASFSDSAFESRIVLVLPYPISANRYWISVRLAPSVKSKTGKPRQMMVPSAEAKAYKTSVGWIARETGIRKPLEGRIKMHLQLYPWLPQDWAKRVKKFGPDWDDTVQCIDLGNCEKVFSDAAQGIVYIDDKQIWQQSKERMEPDELGARLVVTIEPFVRARRLL